MGKPEAIRKKATNSSTTTTTATATTTAVQKPVVPLPIDRPADCDLSEAELRAERYSSLLQMANLTALFNRDKLRYRDFRAERLRTQKTALLSGTEPKQMELYEKYENEFNWGVFRNDLIRDQRLCVLQNQLDSANKMEENTFNELEQRLFDEMHADLCAQRDALRQQLADEAATNGESDDVASQPRMTRSSSAANPPAEPLPSRLRKPVARRPTDPDGPYIVYEAAPSEIDSDLEMMLKSTADHSPNELRLPSPVI